MAYDQNNVRALLLALGVGQYNATMMIEDSFTQPATSDPKSPQIILLVKRIQARLGVPISGYLDQATAAALANTVGPGWMSMSWIDNIKLLLDRTDPSKQPSYNAHAKKMLRPTPPDPHLLNSLEGVFDFLPDIPGGFLTYAAVGGYFLWRHLKKNRRAA